MHCDSSLCLFKNFVDYSMVGENEVWVVVACLEGAHHYEVMKEYDEVLSDVSMIQGK